MPGKCGARLHGHNDPEDPRYGRYCGKVAGHGTDHKGIGPCDTHLGNTKNHKLAAQRTIVDLEVRKEVQTLAEQLQAPVPVGDPMVELYELAGQVKIWQQIITEKMSELSTLTVTDMQGVERPRAIMETWERAVDRASTMYVNLTKLGIMQHKVELEERQAALLFRIVNAVLESPEVGLTTKQLEAARTMLFQEILKAGPRLQPDWFPRDINVDEDEIYDADIV